MWTFGSCCPKPGKVEAEGPCCHTKRPHHSLVIDINIWTECYAMMAAILTSAFPGKGLHFFAYLSFKVSHPRGRALRTITKASRTFESSAWARDVVDMALYSEAFAGQAKLIPQCRYCLADTHSSQECPHTPVDPTSESSDGRQPRGLPRQPGTSGQSTSAVHICRLYNSPGGSRCQFPQCRYAHLCTKRRRPHPAAECGGERRQHTATPQLAPTTAQGGVQPSSA